MSALDASCCVPRQARPRIIPEIILTDRSAFSDRYSQKIDHQQKQKKCNSRFSRTTTTSPSTFARERGSRLAKAASAVETLHRRRIEAYEGSTYEESH